MYIISSLGCISIRKPSVLQQPSKRTTFKQIKEHRLGRNKKNHTGTSSERGFTGRELVPAPVCSFTALPLAAPGYTILPGSRFFWVVFCHFSRPNGFTEGPQNWPKPAQQAEQKPLAAGRYRGQQPPYRQPALKPA